MFPKRIKLLQDTKNAQYLIVLLCLLAIGVVFFRVSSKAASLPLIARTTTTPSPVPRTPGIADALFANILYIRDEGLLEMELPAAISQPLLDPSERSTLTFAPVAPVWSEDGRYSALVTKNGSVLIVDYEKKTVVTQTMFVETIDDPSSVFMQFDPASQILSLGVHAKNDRQSVSFIDIHSGVLVGMYPNCSPKGVWVSGYGFVTTCRIDSLRAINSIRFEKGASLMTPLLRETQSVRYELVSADRAMTVVLVRMTGSKQEFVRLSMQAVVTPMTRQLPKGTTPLDVLRADDLLLARIQQAYSLEKKPDRVVVAGENTWLLYEYQGDIFAAPLDLKKPAQVIAHGRLASIRPIYSPSGKSSIPLSSGSAAVPTRPDIVP